MIGDFSIFDADAHAMMCPKMWEELPAAYAARRPRPVRIEDSGDLGRWTNGWLIEGRLLPAPFGPGAQPGNEPKRVLREFGAPESGHFSIGSITLADPKARVHDLDEAGVDAQMLFPTTLYARMTSEPGFEAALFRCYNRYMARQCAVDPKRLKWAGLLPMRDQREAFEAIDEMQTLGARAAVVFGTVGDRLLSHSSFLPIWEKFASTGLPLCVHMGMSYTPFEQICQNLFETHGIGMSLPAQLAFVALIGDGILDKFPSLKVAFLEFGAEWIFYMIGRLGHYLPIDRHDMPIKDSLPKKSIEEYLASGRLFVAAEAEDRLLAHELAIIGEGAIVCSSDIPHSEKRENSATKIIERTDLSDRQKRKILYDNSVRLFGAP
jgi:predicted TIM-barrel fold metal-dependent hydrolase